MQTLTTLEFFTRLAVGLGCGALIVNNTAGSDIILRGIDTIRAGQGSETTLTARLLLSGDAATHLEQLVARLSLEPGIYAVHWHAADGPVALAAPTADPDEPGEES